MNGNSTVRVQVGRGGDQAVAHVRLHTLGAFADRLGLGDVLSARIRPRGAGPAARSGHDAGAGHADARRAGWRATTSSICASQRGLFGMVPQDSTLYGTFRQLNLDTLGGCRRRWVRWGRGVAPRPAPHPGTTLGMAAPAIHTNPKAPSTVAQEHAKPARRRNVHLMKDQG